MQALSRILAILDIVAESGPIMPAEIAAKMDLPFSTVARLVRQLANEGVLNRHENSGYVLGWRLFDLTAVGRLDVDLATVAIPAMTRLRDQTRETISLHALRGDQRICVAEVQSSLALRRVVPPGTVQQIYPSTGGDVLLLSTSDSAIDELGERLALSPDHLQDLHRRVEAARAAGYSIAESATLGVTALSVPITRRGAVLAAVTVSGPSARFTTAVAGTHADEACEVAGQIGRLV